MALTTSEILRLKHELSFSNVALGADPWIGYTALFDNVISPYLTEGANTTSSTDVPAASSPTPVTLTLASATGFAAFDRVVVDVDSRAETASVSAISGSDVTLLLSKAHSGTFPVQVESGVTQVRHHLWQLQLISQALNGSSTSVTSAGIKKVDEIEFFEPGANASSSTVTSQLADLRHYWRGELAKVCGIYEYWLQRQGGGGMAGGSIALY